MIAASHQWSTGEFRVARMGSLSLRQPDWRRGGVLAFRAGGLSRGRCKLEKSPTQLPNI
jgi:hypothetical protein